ncbi:hypothetical protein ACFYXH_17180 [Streptomyces sp. NPDC002730]|uniref:hypothetical protein n=1 Tax=Streptomyces sp. NPDC002730 TaxID=3364662 RepID=UPI0036BF416E
MPRRCSPSGRTPGPHLYFNPKGGTFGTLSRDGVEVHHEEVGLDAYEESPDSHWLYRFWDWDKSTEMWDAHTLAYAADMAGIWVTDRRAVAGPPGRWVEIPEGSPLLT